MTGPVSLKLLYMYCVNGWAKNAKVKQLCCIFAVQKHCYFWGKKSSQKEIDIAHLRGVTRKQDLKVCFLVTHVICLVMQFCHICKMSSNHFISFPFLFPLPGDQVALQPSGAGIAAEWCLQWEGGSSRSAVWEGGSRGDPLDRQEDRGSSICLCQTQH